MMAIRHVSKPGPYIRDTVGARQDVLIWDRGVTTGHVAAVHMLTDGSADVVIEFEVPQAEIVPDDLCARVGACRFDDRCPYADSCARHACGPDCGGRVR